MSNRARWKKPSGGFVALCLTYLTGALFFAWSLATPDLDRVWTLYHMLKIGGVGHLAQDDRELFGAALTRHDNLAVALLHGAEIGVVSAHDSGWIASPNVTVHYRSVIGR